MEIKLHEIKIRDIVNGYVDSQEDGVVAYGGKLDIRPPYQREFIYDEKERNAVIDTINKNFPLNVMYWVKNGDSYELLDGQQRTLSFCQYVNGDFSLNFRGFNNLTQTEKDAILDYKLMIYICEGTDREKLDWFKIINIAGEKLTDQEMRNAMYTGPWLYDAKRHFSKSNCAAYNMANKYMSGDTLRQAYLETALKWIADSKGIEIEDYMAQHQNDPDADELWQYFCNVINWVEQLYLDTNKNAIYKNKMNNIQWGFLYNTYHNNQYNSNNLRAEAEQLFSDPYVSDKKGVFEYVLSGHHKDDMRMLNIRVFDERTKQLVYNKQNGICPDCKAQGVDKHWEINEMEADHVSAWSRGGATDVDNCQMLCVHHNRLKGNK